MIMPRYKTFVPRVLAGIIDGFLFSPIGILDYFIFQEGRPIILLASWAIISYSLYSIYSVFMHARYGQTLGKMVTKIKVLDKKETEVPGFRRALLRDSIYITISFFSLLLFLFLLFKHGFTHAYENSNIELTIGFLSLGWILLELLTMLTNPRRRALHDFIGGTVVVKLSP